MTEPPVLDVGHLWAEDLADLTFDPAGIDVIIPIPSIGVTNQHIDICSDLIDAAFVAERMARRARATEFQRGYDRSTQRTFVRLRFSGLLPGFDVAFREAVLLFGESDEDDHADEVQALRDAIATFEDESDRGRFRVPDLIDWYQANLVGGAYPAMRSEAPDYYAEQLAAFPERGLGFFRSAHSVGLGADVYASSDSWVVPAAVDLDRFLAQTGQRYRADGLLDGRLLTLDGEAWIVADGAVAPISPESFHRARVCASFAVAKVEADDGLWGEEDFSRWSGFRGSAMCRVDRTGSFAVIADGQFQHVFFDLRPLREAETSALVTVLGSLADLASRGLQTRRPLRCDWSMLSDETFEQLCYDIIREHPRFDPDTIRKYGKSRSRDGGRDIEVREMSRPGAVTPPRKWIFQCKLITTNASLTATRLTDVGDLLDHYAVQGFGVLTSAPIDATLYDKLDAVCSKRRVDQLNMSVLELERALLARPGLRSRYFPAV